MEKSLKRLSDFTDEKYVNIAIKDQGNPEKNIILKTTITKIKNTNKVIVFDVELQ